MNVLNVLFWFLLVKFLAGSRSVTAGPPTLSPSPVPHPVISLPLFQLQRLNYKPYKTLLFHALVEKETCTLSKKNSRPIDVFYIQNDLAHRPRLPMSSSSEEYFGVRDLHWRNDHSLEFTFRALKDFNKAEGNKKSEKSEIILVESFKKGEECQAKAKVLYSGQWHYLKEVEIQFKTFFKLITGLVWVRFKAVPVERKDGKTALLCLFGPCP